VPHIAAGASVARRRTREVGVGSRVIGGDNPVWVQSMTNTATDDPDATTAQIARLEAAGCEVIRVAVPDARALAHVAAIHQRMHVPLVADIHFSHRLAIQCIDAGVDKIRINPGNIGGAERFREVVRHARDKGVPMRIGVNAGSLEEDLLAKFSHPCPEAMVASALRAIEACEAVGYDQVVVSLKSSDVRGTLAGCRLLAQACDYPQHLGITEAGPAPYGIVKSAVGLGAILLEGIGDTLRVSLTGDPVPEVEAGFDILQATGRRLSRPELIACPTCARCQVDLGAVVAELKRRLAGHQVPIRIAVMGCVVNGPGEAREANLGIASGRGKGVLFRRGQVVREVAEADMVDALMAEVTQWEAEHSKAQEDGRR